MSKTGRVDNNQNNLKYVINSYYYFLVFFFNHRPHFFVAFLFFTLTFERHPNTRKGIEL